ncbi:GPI ethanolamine phosphate transferase 1, partial [Clonorchis sinensis]
MDGMRADLLFRYPMEDTPFLRDILLHQGAWGLSHTRAPTESRPGHVALFAGFYEDPSALTTGWKTNPVEFDTVFNHSGKAWAWAVSSVLDALKLDNLPQVHAAAPPRGISSLSADEWSVGRFLATLDNMENGFFANSQVTGENLSVSQSARLAFIHLDASDATGHAANRESPISKSPKYRSLLRQFDGFLSKITRKLKRVSAGLNVRVAFVLTADHGMTDSDGHGGDSLQETITPLLVWGAGLVGPKLSETSSGKHLLTQTDSYGFPVQIEGRRMSEIQQVDLCPLTAALLGIPIPENSRGRLPLTLVSSNDPVKFQMIRANCLQLIAQLQIKLEEKRVNYFTLFFMEYGRLTLEDVANRTQRAETLGAKREYADAIEQYSQLEELTIAALDYYDTYDRKFFRYEVLFLGVFLCVGLLWIQMELPNMAPSKVSCPISPNVHLPLCDRMYSHSQNPRLVFSFLKQCFQIFLLIMSFFGVADVSTLNKLDIRITDCFVTHIEHGSVVYFAILK